MDYASTLPREVLVKIFSGLTHPNPDSVRDLFASASVCPSWRKAAAEPSLWRKLYVDKAPLNARLTGPRLRNLVARSCNTLSWLQLEGCPLLNDAMLVRPLQQQPCLVYVYVRGCALVTRPSLAYAPCDAENFKGVVAQLNDPRQSAADAQRCCVALRTLLGGHKLFALNPAAAVNVHSAVVLDALLHCAALHAAHAGVQAACCWALGKYINFAQGTAVASFPPIFQVVVAALKAHPLDADVQHAALSTLSSVCGFGEGTPGVPALLDAIQPVLAALRAFPAFLNVQRYCCPLLTLMCGMDASVAEAVAAAGAMGLFFRALNLNFSNEGACIAAMDGIGAIALAPAALPQASAGISAVLSALRRHEKSIAVAVVACKTLSIYLRSPATRQRALLSGADFVIKAACAAHSTNAAVKMTAKGALKGVLP